MGCMLQGVLGQFEPLYFLFLQQFCLQFPAGGRVSGKEHGSSLSIANSAISGCCLLGSFLSFSVQENKHSS